MEKIPYWFVLKWFKNHPGDVLRAYIPERKVESIDDKIQKIPVKVFAKLIGDKIYIAKEIDIYDNGLHGFYNELYKLGDKIETKDNYIYCYLYDEYDRDIEFYHFGGDDEEQFLYFQDMPWFSEATMDRMMFEKKLYDCINDNSYCNN